MLGEVLPQGIGKRTSSSSVRVHKLSFVILVRGGALYFPHRQVDLMNYLYLVLPDNKVNQLLSISLSTLGTLY